MQENNAPKIILGLNISMSSIGITLAINENKKLNILDITHFKINISKKLDTMDELFAKCELFSEKLNKYKKYPIDTVIIEDALCKSNNFENNEKLIRFSSMIASYIYYNLKIKPKYISSYEARKFGLPQLMTVRRYNKNGLIYPYVKIKKDLNETNLVLFGDYEWNIGKKEIIWNYISELFPNINWVYNKNGEPTKENFDSSDSLLSIIGYLNKIKYKDVDPKILSINEDNVDDGCIITYVVDFCGKIFEHRIEIKDKKY